MCQWIYAQDNIFVQNCVEITANAVQHAIILGRKCELLVTRVVDDFLAIGMRKLKQSLWLVNVVNVLEQHNVATVKGGGYSRCQLADIVVQHGGHDGIYIRSGFTGYANAIILQ